MIHANTSTTCFDCLPRRGFLTGLLATGAAAVLPSCAVTKPINASPLEAKRDLVDVHHHVWAPAFLKELETRKLAEPPARNWSLNKTLDDMAQAGVTYSITSPTTLPVWRTRMLLNMSPAIRPLEHTNRNTPDMIW